MLLDEPLANLDYKLREELREELPRIFAASGAIFVYATTEPSEALLLGGNTATCAEGAVTQFGADRRRSIAGRTTCDVAQVFSDPPLNIVGVEKTTARSPMPAATAAPADGLFAQLRRRRLYASASAPIICRSAHGHADRHRRSRPRSR